MICRSEDPLMRLCVWCKPSSTRISTLKFVLLDGNRDLKRYVCSRVSVWALGNDKLNWLAILSSHCFVVTLVHNFFRVTGTRTPCRDEIGFSSAHTSTPAESSFSFADHSWSRRQTEILQKAESLKDRGVFLLWRSVSYLWREITQPTHWWF